MASNSSGIVCPENQLKVAHGICEGSAATTVVQDSALKMEQSEVKDPNHANGHTEVSTESKPKKKAKKKDLPNLRIFYGTVVHSTKDEPIVILNKWLIGVEHGKIVFSEPAANLADITERYHLKDIVKNVTIALADGAFLIPGFVNVHASTVPLISSGIQNTRRALDTQHLIRDDSIARNFFNKIIDRSQRYGTTTVAYNGSHIESAVKILSNACARSKQRTFVGFDVCLPEKTEELHMFQMMKTIDVINHIKKQKDRVTPQLIVSTPLAPFLEDKVASIQQQMDLTVKVGVQSHDQGHMTTKDEGRSWLEHHSEHGLLTNKTIVMQHAAVGYTGKQLLQLNNTGASVVYCPRMNNQTSQYTHMDLGRLLDAGIKVALGSGSMSSLSMLDVIRQTMEVDRNPEPEVPVEKTHPEIAVSNGESADQKSGDLTPLKPSRPVTYEEVFRLATLGGAEVLGLDGRVGNFEVGKEFDAVLVDPHVPDCSFFVTPENDSIQDLLEKFLFCGDDRNITAVYIEGQRVK